MYLLSIIVGNASVALMYQSEEKAAAAATLLEQHDAQGFNFAVLSDDFGQTAQIRMKDFHAFIIEDMDRSKMARAEQIIHNARCQAAAQKMGQADAGLRAHHGSPAVITPGMGTNGFRA